MAQLEHVWVEAWIEERRQPNNPRCKTLSRNMGVAWYRLPSESEDMFFGLDEIQRVWLLFLGIVFLAYLYVGYVKNNRYYRISTQAILVWSFFLGWIERPNLFSSVWYLAYYVISFMIVVIPLLLNMRRKTA